MSLLLHVGGESGFLDHRKGIAVFLHEADTEPDFTSATLVAVGTNANLKISQSNFTRLR